MVAGSLGTRALPVFGPSAILRSGPWGTPKYSPTSPGPSRHTEEPSCSKFGHGRPYAFIRQPTTRCAYYYSPWLRWPRLS